MKGISMLVAASAVLVAFLPSLVESRKFREEELSATERAQAVGNTRDLLEFRLRVLLQDRYDAACP
jgi:hypothetical protein